MRLFIRFLLVMFCCIPLASAERSDISAMNQNTAPESKTTPRRLLRGAFYFHYLNDDYQKALSALHQWRSFDGRVNAESHVMEAAILLILGLDGQAQAAYERVEASGGRASGDAWFHLARRWMDVGAWQKAESSINSALQQRLTLNDEYYQQALFIQATSRSHQDLVAEAKVALDSMTPGSVWAGLARYNWMLALIRSNANSRDLENFVEQTLFSLPDTYEGKAIHDRMLLVAGIYALDSGKNRAAEAYFKEISLESAFTAPGLLHYGWSLVEQWKYQEAMQPWRILQQKYNDFHPAVVESILGVPHALELLNATTQSLKTYEVVEIKLQRMLTKLTELNQDAKIDAWLNQWLDQHEGQPWGWMRTELEDMPDSDMTRALQLMLDDRQFNQLTEQLYDLKRLADELAQQQRDLELWQQILKQRQQQLRSAGGAQRLMALEKRHRALVDEVLDMQQQLHAEDAKIFAFASTQDTKNIEHLSSVVPRVEYLHQINTPTRDLSQYKQRWRRMRGLQLWKIYEEKPSRRWQSNRSFWQLRQHSEQLLEQLSNSRKALAWADSSWKGFPQQVQRSEQKVLQLQQQVERLYQQQHEAMRVVIHEFLNNLEVRLTDYLAQSRLSIARLYDDALQNNVAAGGHDDYQHPTVSDDVESSAAAQGSTDSPSAANIPAQTGGGHE